MKKRAHIIYSGMVQGVGFRWTTREIARELAVSGWVKNRQDGSVEIEVEADEDILGFFMDRILQHFSRYIRNVALDWKDPTGDKTEFSVKF